MKFIAMAASGALLLTACATVTKGTSEKVQFTSNPSGLEVETTLGTSCTTPCVMTISRKDEFVATFRKGRDIRKISVLTKIRDGGGAALAGNILAGGVIGIGIDASNGSTLDHVPNPVHADFDKPQAEQIDGARFMKLEKEKREAAE